MNLTKFEDQVRNQMQPLDEPPGLEERIDRAIANPPARTARNRWPVAFAACALVTFGLFAFPVVRAQAELNRIAGALDGVSAMVITRYAVRPDGTLKASGTTSYLDGRWRIDDPGGTGTMIFRDGTRYSLDPFTGCYITETNTPGPYGTNSSSMKLSSLLRLEQRPLGNMSVEIDREASLNGRPAIRARFVNSPFNERLSYFADPKTELPFEVRCEAQERGVWRLVMVMQCDYTPKLAGSLFEPDLKQHPPLTKAEWGQRVVKTLTTSDLGSTPLKKGRLTVRAIDVAEDGTVYVAYQSGSRTPNQWVGYGLEVTDDLGSKYCHAIEIFSQMDQAFISSSVDGKLEIEAFVPIEPLAPDRKRTISVTATLTPAKTLSHSIRFGVTQPDGSVDMGWTKNRQGAQDRAVGDHLIELVRKTIARPTCTTAPSYMTLVDLTSYGNDIRALISAARARVRYYLDERQYAAAEFWLHRQLGLIDEHEARGYGSYSRDEALKQLDEVRSKLAHR